MVKKAIKRILIFCLIAIMNINTHATMSYHDGSTFVTKAEFDSFTQRFKDQYENFKSNINEMIDDAVAKYLAGLSGVTEEHKKVGYFASLPSNVTSVTMRPYNSFAYASGYPIVYANAIMNGIYTRNYTYSCNGYLNYTSYSSSYYSSRRFVTNENGIYRWQGYTTNYKETFYITWCRYTGSTDTGYNWASPYLYVFGASAFSTTSVSTGSYWTSFYWHIGDGNKSPGTATYATVSTAWNGFTFNNQYDLMYEDYPSSSQTSNNMRLFIKGNPNNRWFAGSSVSYLTVTANGSRGGSCRINADGVVTKSISSYNYITSSSYNTAYYTCGFEPNITSWSKVYNYDTQVYKSGTNQISNYSMIDGAAFGEVKKGYEYTWPVSFTNTSSVTNIWIKYGVFNGPPGSDADIKNDSNYISFKVDGGEEVKKGAVTGKGTITFKAPKSGILFFKWTSGRSMYVSASSKASYTYDLLDPDIDRNN